MVKLYLLHVQVKVVKHSFFEALDVLLFSLCECTCKL
jgi:hypothetical protein